MTNLPKEIHDDKYVIKSKEQQDSETRSVEFKKLVNSIVINKLGPDIAKLDDIAEEHGMDKAWEHVGLLVHQGVEAGLMFQAKKVQKLQKKVEDLEGKK